MCQALLSTGDSAMKQIDAAPSLQGCVAVKQTVSKYTNDSQDWLRITAICCEAHGMQ